MSEPVANGGADPDDQAEQVDQGIQRTLIAILAGWLVPGAGHAVLGRVRRVNLRLPPRQQALQHPAYRYRHCHRSRDVLPAAGQLHEGSC